MTFLPSSYASPIDLPFNRASLDQRFEFSTPGRDPGGSGVWLLLQGNRLFFLNSDRQYALPAGELPAEVKSDMDPLYLGSWDGQPCRLVSLVDKTDMPDQWESESLLARDPQLPLPLLSLGGLGHMILHWERVSRHCGNCGGKMQHLPGEWGKQCESCGAVHFPRIHPCVIVLVRKGEELLLVRKPEWVGNRYGLVAGFVDPGESLEETVVRELREEVGIEVTGIRYIGSQCWPFPSQLMTGFAAEYAGGDIVLQVEELAEADWFHRDQLPTLPPHRSIARYLIDAAVNGTL